MKALFHDKIEYLLSFIMILGVAIIFGGQVIESPGLYYDAIFPDYVGAIFAFPGVENAYQITNCTFWPLLGNFYYGTTGAFVQFIILKLLGGTNICVLRMTNICVLALIEFIFFTIVYKVTSNYYLSLIISILSVSTSNLIELTRTQFFVMQWGALFMAVSFAFVYRFYSSETYLDLVLAGLFQGLAFYGYFSYLFFGVGTLVIICLTQKKNKYEKFFVYCCSIVLGSVLYFIGIFDSILINIMGRNGLQKGLFIMGTVAIVIVLSIVPLTYIVPSLVTYRARISSLFLILVVLGITCALGVLIINWEIFKDTILAPFTMVSGLGNRNQGGRMITFWLLLYNLVSNRIGQVLIFGENFYEISWFWSALYIIGTCICGGIIYRKKRANVDLSASEYVIIASWIYILMFYIISLPIVKSMQEQHLVGFYYIMYAGIALYISSIYESIKDAKVRKVVLLIIVFVGISINTFNIHAISEKLMTVGGRGSFTDAINEFSSKAKAIEDKENIVYVFPEWGFYSGFVYLTENSCLALRDVDIDVNELQHFINSGKRVCIVAWNKATIDEISDQLENVSKEETIWNSKEGVKSFYEVHLLNSKMEVIE